jgi:hypothetical protein
MDRRVVSLEMGDKGPLEMVQLLALGDIIERTGAEIRKPCGLAGWNNPENRSSR